MLPIVVKRKLCECCDKKEEQEGDDGREGRDERERRCAREAMFFSPMEVDQLWLRRQREKQDRRASSLYSYEEDVRSASGSQGEKGQGEDQNDESGESGEEESGEEDTSGCTLCAVLITPSGRVFVSNVGDTRAVMARNSGEFVVKYDFVFRNLDDIQKYF